jgi:hypothetical protein
MEEDMERRNAMVEGEFTEGEVDYGCEDEESIGSTVLGF